MKKKEKLNLVQWGQLSFSVTVSRCPKCGDHMEDVQAFGVMALSVCKKCKKFYGLVIEDVTTKLSAKFRKENL